MKTFLHIIGCVLVLYGCNEVDEEIEDKVFANSLEDSEKNFLLIKDGLYEDGEGKLYHRTIDVSIIGNPVYRYNDCLMVDTIIDGMETFNTPLISDVIDKESFHIVSIDSSGNSLEVKYYEDKNHKYFLLVVADGGTLHMN